MSLYDIPPYARERLRYHDGQFLTSKDFVDEQHYHLDRQRRLPRLLHVSGVAEGLEVTRIKNNTSIQVAPGTAIDQLGRQILLDTNREVTLAEISNGTYSIVILYGEQEGVQSPGSGANARFIDTPDVTLVAATANLPLYSVVLGCVTVESKLAKDVLTTGRVYSGLRLPGSGSKAGVLRAKMKETTLRAELDCSLSLKEDLFVTGNLELTGLLRPSAGNAAGKGICFPANPGGGGGDEAYIRYFAPVAGIEKTKLEIGIRDNEDDVLSFFQYGAERMTISKGNVGIGTTDPEDKLSVQGNLRILTSTNPIRFTSTWSGHAGPNQAEISNDTNLYKSLMIVGNTSAGGQKRRVSVWDHLHVHGILTYDEQLSKLDVAENGTATLRCHDLMIGHSSRLGKAGLALVDELDTAGNHALVINYASDWPAVAFHSKVGIGINNPQETLHVEGNLKLSGYADLGSNPIRFTSTWSGHAGPNQAEISNDTNLYKSLMIVGNTSAGDQKRRVSVWDHLHVHGILTYDEQLSKLDVAENGTATLRCHDLMIGHTTRLGKAGLALVDELDTAGNHALVINYASDWPAVAFHSKVGIGINNPQETLHVEGNLKLSGYADLGYEKEINDFDQALTTGAYQAKGSTPGDIPDNSYLYNWKHLLVLRHSNQGTDHQLQIASSFSENDRLFFRKIARFDTTSQRPPWNEVATRKDLENLKEALKPSINAQDAYDPRIVHYHTTSLRATSVLGWRMDHVAKIVLRITPEDGWEEGTQAFDVDCTIEHSSSNSLLFRIPDFTNPGEAYWWATGSVRLYYLGVANPVSCEQTFDILSNAYKGLAQSGPAPRREVAATYDYTDESGVLLFQTVRYRPKLFRFRRPDGNGGWIDNIGGVRRVLYHLPEVVVAQNVLIVEGEKDVETARRLGLPDRTWAATTSPGPVEWRSIYAESLRGKNIVICPDTDKFGQRYLRHIVLDLDAKAARIRWAKLPAGFKDLSEWVDAGATKEQLAALIHDAQAVDSKNLPNEQAYEESPKTSEGK